MTWLIVLIGSLLLAGHIEFWALIVNRVQSLAIPNYWDRLVGIFNALTVGGIPVAFLLTEQPWTSEFASSYSSGNVCPCWGTYSLCCVAGLVSLGVRTIVRQTAKPCPLVMRDESTTVIPDEQTGPDGASGRAAFIARLPANESRSFEVHELTFAHPALPSEWDGLKIAHLSDTHFAHGLGKNYFVQACERLNEFQADLLIFSGDLLDDPSRLSWVPDTLGKMRAPLGQYFVLGNHDWHRGAEPIRAEVKSAGWRDVSGEVISVEHLGRKLVIAGTEQPWMGQSPDFTQVEADFRLLVSHCPDQFPFAQKNNVDLMLAGHTHGGQIKFPGFGPLYSPSWYGTRYADGSFWNEPTLMYVSRGLSGETPLRYGSPPEVTLITLKSAVDAYHADTI
ncbi:metallophosphoesterase [Calycomorphotria hydatis]|uniref:Putative metallophosphoesterase n=1 Tax=Calycomorphotria hydatis TaxID=2528027 RepID=A0A517TBX0_9PLAN|nr:metallophosphoesterase [Calycomorphotria hydatis]QDT65863.1 putative metallophosphoesterase [Calycomorphotria hydatis]